MRTLNEEEKKQYCRQLLEHSEVNQIISLALLEDGISNDLTTKATFFKPHPNKTKSIRANVITKRATVACGQPLIQQIINAAQMQSSVKASFFVNDGEWMKPNTLWFMLEGSAQHILALERVILNFLLRTCGIATTTKMAVELIAATNTKILHTRKTAPGHRRSDIYACLIGGAYPHRLNLADAILVKENHLRANNSIVEIVDGINHYRDQASFVEIEVTDFVELKYALLAKPDRIMLDNFSVENVQKAVDLFGSATQFEASGNINLTNLPAYASTGVDYVSMGWLTHSFLAADLSMLFSYDAN